MILPGKGHLKMESRKKQNREIEAQNKRRKLIERSIFVVVALLILGGIGFTIWNTQSMQWALRFNDERITAGEFRFFGGLFGADLSDEEMRELVLEHFVSDLAVLDRANRHSLTLDEAEMMSIFASADSQLSFYEMMWGEIIAATLPNRDRAAELLSANQFREQLMDLYVANHQVNEAELAQAWAEFQIERYDDFMTREVMYIFNHDPGQIIAAYDLVPERDFRTLEEFSTTSAFTMELNEFAEMFSLTWEDYDEIMALEIGSAVPLEVEGGFVLVYLSAINSPDWDEWEEPFRDNFIFGERAEILNGLIEGWVAEANVVRNNRRLNAF